VPISAPYSLTECRRFFEEPATARQRQYEALRAYFVEEMPSSEAARCFGYSPGAFRVLCHSFRHRQLPELFATGRTGPRGQPKKSRAVEQIVALRKRNYSVYEISQALRRVRSSAISSICQPMSPSPKVRSLCASTVVPTSQSFSPRV